MLNGQGTYFLQETLTHLPSVNRPANIIYVIFLLLLSVLAYVFAYYAKQVKKIFIAAFDEKAKNSLIRDDSETIKKVAWLLNLCFFISFSLLIFALNFRYNWFKLSNNWEHITFICLLGAIFGLKYLFHLVIAWLFNTYELTRSYLTDSYIKFKFFGVISLPITLIILHNQSLYHKTSVLIALGFVIIWLLKCYKGIVYAYHYNLFPLVYAFLYICTLEILPFIIIAKFVLK